MSQILLLNRLKPTNDSVATADSVKWDESKHPRKGGKFAPKGTGTTGKTGGKETAKKFASSSGSVGWHKWLTSKKDSADKGGGAKGSRPAQTTAKWLKSNGKNVTDKQFSAILRLVDRWGKTPAGAYKSIVGKGDTKSGGKSGGTGKVELTPAAKLMAKMLRGGLGGSRVITSIKYNSKHDYKKSDLIAAYKSVYGENYKRVMKKHKV